MKIRQFVSKSLLLVSATSLVACVATDVQAKSQPPRVYVGSCVFGVDEKPALSGESAILASMVGAIIKVGFNSIGKALRAAGEEQTTTRTGLRNTEFTPGRAASCIQYVSGGIGSTGSCLAAGAVSVGTKAPSQLAGQCAKLKAAGIYLSSMPNLFLELQLRHSTAGSAYAVSPTFLSYQSKMKDGKFKKGENRGLVAQARFHATGVTANGNGSVGGAIVLGDVGVGTERLYDHPKPGDTDKVWWELESAWFPALNPPVKDMPAKGSPDASDPKHPGNAKIPLTVTVSVTETRSARKFYLFLADVFDESKEELQASTEKLLIQSRQEEAELAAFTAAQTALVSADQKHVAAEIAIIAYCAANYAAVSGSARDTLALTNSGAARVAQIGANMSARAAGRPGAYPTLVEISKAVPVVGTTEGC